MLKIVCGFIVAMMFVATMPAHATSVRDYEAMSQDQGSKLVTDFIIKMSNDISVKNPKLGRDIVNYFVYPPKGKPQPAGFEDLLVQLLTVDELAKQGKADKDKIQVESMIVYVVKQKFMKPQTAPTGSKI